VIALVKRAQAAEVALPAGGLKTAEHAVADLDAAHLIARRKHLSDVLVADREARGDLHATVVDVQIRAAHTGRQDPHDRVARVAQLRLWEILYRDPAGRLEGDRSHDHPP
jgi:hypothetical protein